MSELYPVLILKGLSWLLMARFTPYSRAVVAQMWPRGGEGKAAIRSRAIFGVDDIWRGTAVPPENSGVPAHYDQ